MPQTHGGERKTPRTASRAPKGWLPVWTSVAGTNRVFASPQVMRILARRLGLRLVSEERWAGSECVFWVLHKP